MSGARLALGLGMAGLLAWRGLKKKSLSKSGAVSAFGVGVLSLMGSLRGGLTMIGFYVASSRLTKMGAERKKQVEEEYQIGGMRGASQVLACSLIATVLSLVHFVYVDVDDQSVFPDQMNELSKMLTLGIAAHYSCANADTWSSEIGVLAKSTPRLITKPWTTVPPGTNGGVTLLGLAASAAGGAYIGLVMKTAGYFTCSDAPTLRSDLELIPLCTLYGVIGSLLDSLLGAWVQETLYDKAEKKIVKSKGPDVVRISGYPLLDNEQVNLVSVALCTGLGVLSGMLL